MGKGNGLPDRLSREMIDGEHSEGKRPDTAAGSTSHPGPFDEFINMDDDELDSELEDSLPDD